jgi:hypothetical protein
MTQWYRQWRTHTAHPNLTIDYFKRVHTKEKAYWLGFLFADGFITRTSRGTVQIGIKLAQKDEDTIDRFCECLGLDKGRKQYLTGEGGKKQVRIIFACKKISNDLLKQGLTFRKSRIIEYPHLPQRNLDLAFLLGFYDGDGHQNSTEISTGSIRFLKQIKNRFGLPYKIRVEESLGITGMKIKGIKYSMHLGAELFNEMMRNYGQSMPRKRRLFCDSRERARRTAEACAPEKIKKRKELQREWRAITKDELERLVWEMPLSHIAMRYDVRNVSVIVMKCERFGIARPEQGYWQERYWAKRRSLEKSPK